MSVYIDSNIFIMAALESSKSKRARELLRNTRLGYLGKAFTASLTFDEVFWKIKTTKGIESACLAVDAMLTMPNLELVSVNRDMIWLAFNLIKKYDLDPRDAIHAACALSNKAKYIISEDMDFYKIKEIKRKSL